MYSFLDEANELNSVALYRAALSQLSTIKTINKYINILMNI